MSCKENILIQIRSFCVIYRKTFLKMKVKKKLWRETLKEWRLSLASKVSGQMGSNVTGGMGSKGDQRLVGQILGPKVSGQMGSGIDSKAKWTNGVRYWVQN